MSSRVGDDDRAMLDPRVIDPTGDLVHLEGIEPGVIDEVVELMAAMRGWKEAERVSREASQRYMRLGQTDMRALRFIIAQQNLGVVVTARAIAAHIRISTASTTKLLDRLAAGGHIERTPHPSDRRALAIVVTGATRAAARASVGRKHARRFDVAAALSSRDRRVVMAFFEAMALAEQEPPAVQPS